ncbi:hypothetical protein TELCIR_02770 [Teladorsagia circumcincta]|uniref:MADF domain-containing protein n=1 Tax=Teladorsagia circumcincta TaxID=45464 RepID=A0A2G9UY83_TELCI|nr:hypothetical protein TELCIR_02770 [Teladorsagia circumcincta]
MATVEVKPLSGETTKEVIVDVKSVILSEMSKEIENHAKSVDGDEKEAELGMGQYPCTADDHFEIRLIDAVEKNPCPGVELERKWRHMRDRYVRLRKIDKTSAPLKKGDKWYYYYKKMSFLDPYIEHRNRRKRGDLMTSLMKLGGNERNDEEEASDSGEGEIEDRCDPLKEFYASFAEQSMAMPLPIDVEYNDKQSQSAGSSGKKRKLEDVHEEDVGDTEVSLFVRSIEKSLSGMDARTFALARLEISRVLFDCQYGDRKLV